jgi:hypothetical protein
MYDFRHHNKEILATPMKSNLRMNTIDIWKSIGISYVKQNSGWVERDEKAFASLYSNINKDVSTEEVQTLFVQSTCLGKWAMSGFPTIRMGHKTAAGFMATHLNPEMAPEMVRSPWPGFVIKVPGDMIHFFNDEKDSNDPVSCIAVCQLNNGRWNYCISTNVNSGFQTGGISVWAHAVPTKSLAGEPIDWSKTILPRSGMQPTDIDLRSEELAKNLIIGCCLHFSESAKKEEARVKPVGRGVRNRPPGQVPDFTHFEIRQDVSIDVLSAVKEYARNGGGSPKVQFLVRGHWKMQPYGKGGLERKQIYVAPFWKGPLDAPVIMKTGI